MLARGGILDSTMVLEDTKGLVARKSRSNSTGYLTEETMSTCSDGEASEGSEASTVSLEQLPAPAALEAAWDAVRDAPDVWTRKLGGKLGAVAQFVPGRDTQLEMYLRSGYAPAVPRVDEPWTEQGAAALRGGAVLGYLAPCPTADSRAGPAAAALALWVSADPFLRAYGARWSAEAAPGALTVMLHGNPACHGHFILTTPEPRAQVLGPELLTAALLLQQADPAGRRARAHLAFSSLGAGARANQDHWEGFTGALPVLDRPRVTRTLVHSPRARVTLEVVQGWPLPFVGVRGPTHAVVLEVQRFVEALRDLNLAYTVLVARGRVWVCPRARRNCPDTAALEACGVFVLPTAKEFERLSDADAAGQLERARPDPLLLAEACAAANWPEDLW